MHAPFTTIALVGRFADPLVADAMLALAVHAQARGIRVLIDADCPIEFGIEVERLRESELARHTELVVSVGGDGTLLYAARLALGSNVPLLGINRGRLGFLADVSAGEMLERFDEASLSLYQRPWGTKTQKVGKAAGAILRSQSRLIIRFQIAAR